MIFSVDPGLKVSDLRMFFLQVIGLLFRSFVYPVVVTFILVPSKGVAHS